MSPRRYRDPDELHDAVANGDREPPPGWPTRPRVPLPIRQHIYRNIDTRKPCGSIENPHVVRSPLDRECANCGKPAGVITRPAESP